uniref:Caprin-1 dimerization domain-containing protein n=1 Tax=Setaria digitata TaxID=48799 RepID=A0A915Q4S4_9BILA
MCFERFLADMKGPESIQCSADSILSNPYAGVQFAFDKRRRNLEKRKSRLLQYEADLKDGKKLSEQQIEARYCIGEVETQLEFLKDITRVFQSLQKEYLRGVKQRDDGVKKEYAEHERKRLEDFIYFRNIVERFGKLEVKEALLNGTDNTKITEEECKVIEDLKEPFGLSSGDLDNFMDFKKKCAEDSKLAYKILIGSKEKIMNDFSGLQIRDLLEKVANCGRMWDVAKEEGKFVKPVDSVLESEVEQPKKDPKVVFVHVANGSIENYVEGDMNQAGDTEFGFEGGVDPKALVRDPPPPIPFPVTVVPEDPTNTVTGANHNDVWRAEAKPEVSSKRRAEGGQDGFMNGVEQMNGFGARSGERRQIRPAKSSSVQRNEFGGGDAKGSDFGKGLEGEQRGRIGGGGRRQERENFDGSRNARVTRNSGRGFGSSGGRGAASNFVPRGSGFRNVSGSNNQMNGSIKGNGGGGGFSGYGYNGPPQPPRRQLGFNFASDAF